MLHPQKEHGDRSNAPNVVVLITDGPSIIDSWRTVDIAKSVREAGMNIFVIGVGTHVDVNEMTDIAGSRDRMLYVWDFTKLLREHTLRSMYSRICSKCSFYKIQYFERERNARTHARTQASLYAVSQTGSLAVRTQASMYFRLLKLTEFHRRVT